MKNNQNLITSGFNAMVIDGTRSINKKLEMAARLEEKGNMRLAMIAFEQALKEERIMDFLVNNNN